MAPPRRCERVIKRFYHALQGGGAASDLSRILDFSTHLFQTLHLLQVRRCAIAHAFHSLCLGQHAIGFVQALLDLVARLRQQKKTRGCAAVQDVQFEAPVAKILATS
jgi:hypothetical protein